MWTVDFLSVNKATILIRSSPGAREPCTTSRAAPRAGPLKVSHAVKEPKGWTHLSGIQPSQLKAFFKVNSLCTLFTSVHWGVVQLSFWHSTRCPIYTVEAKTQFFCVWFLSELHNRWGRGVGSPWWLNGATSHPRADAYESGSVTAQRYCFTRRFLNVMESKKRSCQLGLTMYIRWGSTTTY